MKGINKMQQPILKDFSIWLFWNTKTGFESCVDEYIEDLKKRNVQVEVTLRDFEVALIEMYIEKPMRFWNNIENLCDFIDLIHEYPGAKF